MHRVHSSSSKRLILIVAVVIAALAQSWGITAQVPVPKAGAIKFATIDPNDLKKNLTYLSSDQLLGREVFTEGYGIAAQYIADHLEAMGVLPMGDDGTYFEMVKLNDVKIANDNSSVTLEVNGQTKTFKNGDGVRFLGLIGGKHTITLNGAEFLGYGLNAPAHDDYKGHDVKGKAVVWMGTQPADARALGNRIITGRSAHAVEEAWAAASISYVDPSAANAGGGRRGAPPAAASAPGTPAAAPAGRQGGARMLGGIRIATATQGDFTTTQSLDLKRAPQITAGDAFFEFLFSAAPTKFAAIKAVATAQAAAAAAAPQPASAPAPVTPMPAFSLANVKITINVDVNYHVLQTLYTRNVVGKIEGTDPQLKNTYVMFGAHLDHIGYSPNPNGGARGGGRGGAGAATTPPASDVKPDVINNGADDDGSGTVGELAIAKAFATGPKPKRSLIFVWHAGEEAGLLGSKYNADFPIVPLDKVVADLNIDMIGRNRDNDAKYENSVYVIGADRISTDLHNAVVETDATLASPVTLDYEYNDPTDSNGFYFRSDHYSYAAKGIPIAFFFTGTHPDYHRVTDSVEKIHFDKAAHIAQLVYETGFNIANSDKAPERDNQGPRSGKGFSGTIKR